MRLPVDLSSLTTHCTDTGEVLLVTVHNATQSTAFVQQVSQKRYCLVPPIYTQQINHEVL